MLHRRTAGAKFVPPIKQDEGGGSGSNFTSRVTSKVMSHGGSSSEGGGGCLPPELEGNERLRNIEPRMVELILNEVNHVLERCIKPYTCTMGKHCTVLVQW